MVDSYTSNFPAVWPASWRIAVAAALGLGLGFLGAWLESLAFTFWITLALIPVAFLLDLVLEVGIEVLGERAKLVRLFIFIALIISYLAAWVAFRG